MNLNQTQRGARKSGGANPNLTQAPYVTGGIEGSVQYRGTNEALDGDSNFIWNKITRLLSIFGSLFIKSTNSISGNALEVQNSSGVSVLRATNNGYIFGGSTVARVGYSEANYSLYQAGSFAVFVTGVVRMQLLATSLDLSVPLSVSSITNVNSLTSGANMIFRSAAGGSATDGFDMRYYAGKGGTSAFKSGIVKLGYRQQDNTDVDVLTMQEHTANSTDGKAHIIFAIKEVYADNAAALAASAPVNTLYRTPTGEVRIVV